ncbi:hypothetical protein Tco_1001863 [Tanacetum coccineum]
MFVGWIIDYGASQHMPFTKTYLFNIIDVSHLDITVAHPNGTKAKVNQIRSCKLNDNLVIHDVLVVPGYQVSLLSASKLAKDNKLSVCFNEKDCVIQDSVLKRTLWHNRLGHPTDQVLSVLKNDIDLKGDFSSEPCDVTTAVLSRNVPTISLIANETSTLEYLIGSNGINNLNFFDVQRSNDPNDDVRVNSEGEGTNPSCVEPAVESDDADRCPTTEPSASTSNESFDKSGSKSSYDVNSEMLGSITAHGPTDNGGATPEDDMFIYEGEDLDYTI